MTASAFTRPPVVEVVLVAMTTAVVEGLALLVVRVKMPLLDVLRTATVKRRHVANGNCIAAKLFALFEGLKVVFVSVTTGVSELAANSVSPVEVVAAGLFVARAGSVRKHASVSLFGDGWSCGWLLSSVVLARWLLWSRWLRSWPLHFFSGAASLAVRLGQEAVLVAAAASVVELTAALDLRVEVPVGDVGLAVADVGGQLASVLDYVTNKMLKSRLLAAHSTQIPYQRSTDIFRNMNFRSHSYFHFHHNQNNKTACICYRFQRNASELAFRRTRQTLWPNYSFLFCFSGK